jgi:hypothetical protein
MHPERASRLLSILGAYLLVAALILRVTSLVMTTWQSRTGWQDTVVPPSIPALGQYELSPDGKQVNFSQQIDAKGNIGWFTMPLEGGLVTQTQPPQENLGPFLVKYGLVYLLINNEYVRVSGAPRENRVSAFARSPDGAMLAFVASDESENRGLYIVSSAGLLIWLGDQEKISEITWSPDSQSVAFLALVNGVNQLFMVGRDGQIQRKLTNDLTNKSSPRWSPDGRSIAYIASTAENRNISFNQAHPIPYAIPEAPVKWSIRLIDMAGESPRQFAEDNQVKANLGWGLEGSDPVIVYSMLHRNQLTTRYLYSLNPRTGQSRRVYPPLEINPFTCPSHIQAGQPTALAISITNSGLRQADVTTVLRANHRAFDPIIPTKLNVVLTDQVEIPPGSSQTVEWPFQAQPGLFSHLSVQINPNGVFAMDEKRCTVRNTYYGLPNLPFLKTILPLTVIGLVFCLPWLRQKKKTRFWVLYLAYPLLILLTLIIETKIVGM